MALEARASRAQGRDLTSAFVEFSPRATLPITAPQRSPMRIGSIVIHCHEFDRMVTFWQAALHYVPRAPAQGGWVVLRDPEDRGPNLSFQARPERRRGRSWLHLDLYTSDQAGE